MNVLFISSHTFQYYGGQARIRTLEADGSRFTVCPLCPLGYLPVQQLNRSAVPSYIKIKKNTGKCKAGIQDKAQFLLQNR